MIFISFDFLKSTFRFKKEEGKIYEKGKTYLGEKMFLQMLFMGEV